jgi:hypothetical protein
MATLKDEEEQKGQGTSQVLGQGMAQPAQPTGQAPQQAQSSAPAMIGSSATQTSAPVQNMPKQKAGTGSFANLKSYLQAAQGGGQQKIAQAATQQVQKLGTGAQRGLQQAQEAFGRRMEAGSLANMGTAQQEAADVISTARGTTYQAPQPATTTTQPTTEQTGTQATEEASAQPTPPQPAQPQQYFTPEQQQRFAEIINAQYPKG